jgi:hypothetical protein
MEMPATVLRAVVLLWIALVVAAIATMVSFAGQNMTDLMLFLLVVYAANGYIIHKASERANWARYVIGVFAVVGAAVTFYPWEPDPHPSAWEWVEAAVVSAAEIVAVYWLFTGEGAKWYRAQVA